MIPHISLLELLEGARDSIGRGWNGGQGGQVTEPAPFLGSYAPPGRAFGRADLPTGWGGERRFAPVLSWLWRGGGVRVARDQIGELGDGHGPRHPGWERDLDAEYGVGGRAAQVDGRQGQV